MSRSMTAGSGRLLDEEQLNAWGECIGRAAASAGLFVALYGDLGAGKSTLARAACRGLGIQGAVPSPTYTLVNVHRSGDTILYHADLYRINETATEASLETVLIDAGWPDVLEADGPVFVEWAELAGGWLPADRWDVRIEFTPDPSVRLVSVKSLGTVPPPPDCPC